MTTDISQDLVQFKNDLVKYYNDDISPWRSFLDIYQFNIPSSGSQVLSRLQKNLVHYRCNYVCVAFGILCIFMLTCGLGFLLVCIIGIMGYLYLIAMSQRSIVNGNPQSLQLSIPLLSNPITCERNISFFIWSGIVLILIYFFGGLGRILGLIGTCCMVVGFHGTFHEPEPEIEQDQV